MRASATPQGHFAVRVYYEDTDHGGVVYHANYLRFMERARTEMLRERGLELDQLERDDGVIFAVRRARLDFRAPARFNHLLDIETQIDEVRPLRMRFTQQVAHAGMLLCRGEVEVACLTAADFRPTPIPRHVLRAFFPDHP
ncbi:tol-pal system-associated acyl-CoA thioesterase [Acidithiobacillus sp. CV18-2]|uniref:Tol-pal system-associated acyl-CoA thioesterase n=1 Tax=Igneacidithiobacillus copahuensis TaxID=2724909 RepID=A0AAE3CKY8_9PROT|nr:tol-pal system-associated acyl-CoA thioesterase [Igneacidithiobacillus copahuensis]MBU2755141.1 tol-pal system-associated acyl-CoA thioesterase [Acidithiobacillus sp. CV18-3]MBU2758111.1 tol-pal system-associated acyl-CoA thioesterase [Acidithiobacillus sp. BN09-2]MBU2777711.1 tol-pal system-associated acyl-CoA thioesterase [Acidithiobacillus sp. CV18-2]MBU2797047.1 tol-pal system-associated acyl-CoA thioesterase [Acidithiobacillus sp. VAN18-2]MBU2798375.1 tol-pal system-associated acyl-CoA